MLGSIIAWIIIGLIAGAIAKAIMPGKDPGGAIVTILLGIAGAVVGGFIGQALGIGGRSDTVGDTGWLMAIVFAVIGAIILLALYRLVTGRSMRA